LKTTAELTISCADEKVRASLGSVLTPDNEGAPRGLEVSMSGSGEVLTFALRSGAPRVAISTALAILRDVSLFKEVWLLSHGGDARSAGDRQS
jgi:hypothetical protein